MDYLIFTDDLVPYVGTSFMLNRGTFFIVPIHTLFIEISEFEIATKEAIILKPQGEIWICGVLSRCFLNGKPKTNTGLIITNITYTQEIDLLYSISIGNTRCNLKIFG